MERGIQTKEEARKQKIREELEKHLAGDGTPNDSTTDSLYREWFKVQEDDDTDLEEVEAWAFNLINGKAQ